MGLVKFGAGVSQISGKVGGMIYSKNKGGSYVRNFKAPTNPNTTRQADVRSVFSDLASLWMNTLTQAQRDAWNLFAENTPVLNRLGETIYLTGLNHYIRSNSLILQAGGTRVDAGPTLFTLPSWSGMTPTASEASQEVSIEFANTDDWANQDNGFLSIFMAKPTNPSVKGSGGPWRYIGSIAGDSVTPPTSPATIAVAWPVTEGQRIGIRFAVCEEDGRVLSSPFWGSILIGA